MNSYRLWRESGLVVFMSIITIIILVCTMFFSPLSLQFTDNSVSRGSSWVMDIDALVDGSQPEQALNLVDS